MTGKLLEKRLDEIQGNMLDFALMLTADAGVADRLVKESVSRVLESGYCSDDRGVRFKSRVYVIMREVFDETVEEGGGNHNCLDKAYKQSNYHRP